MGDFGIILGLEYAKTFLAEKIPFNGCKWPTF